MSDKSKKDRLYDILVDQLGIEKSEINDNSQIVQDLGADSLDVVEILMTLEDEFDIEIPDEEAEKIKTVGETLQYLEEATKG